MFSRSNEERRFEHLRWAFLSRSIMRKILSTLCFRQSWRAKGKQKRC